MSSRDFLERLLDDEEPTPAQLDETIRVCADEDQFIEYKDGRITTQKSEKELKREILFHVTGFANAEGGVLVVGVSEDRPRNVTGARAPGGSTLVQWATRVLSRSLGSFSPSPRILAVQHRDGVVLLIAVARAPQLVPYVEAGDLRYALRLGDSTCDVPPYLISDLVLGRRNHPVLKLHDVSLRVDSMDEDRILFEPQIQVDNLSLTASLNTTIGAVSWYWDHSMGEPNEVLQRYVEAKPPKGGIPGRDRGEVWNLRHLVNRNIDATIRAYSRHRDSLERIRLPPRPESGVVTFGLYIMPRQSPAIWYEVECLYTLDREERPPRLSLANPKFKPSKRPTVTWWSR